MKTKNLAGLIITMLLPTGLYAEVDGNMAKYAAIQDAPPNYAKSYQGFAVENCRYALASVDFCTDRNLKNLANASLNSKRPLFMNKYDVFLVRSTAKPLTMLAIVDRNTKKIYTSPYEFSSSVKVNYNIQGKPEIYIFGEINSAEYGGDWGSDKSPVILKFDEKDKIFYPYVDMSPLK